jgi:asparagine synthase (glutamine-hydrolysing)
VHQRSDVPYGLFLSGGVDSAAIAVIMARLNDRPVTAFTCGFDAPGAHDERRSAERLAQGLGLDWRPLVFGADDFWRLAPQAAAILDDPTSDFAALPTLRLAEAARGTLKVVLTGEGGDEMFAGYGRYRRALRPGWLGGRPAEPQPHAIGSTIIRADALAAWRAAGDHAAGAEGLSRLQQAQARDVAAWLANDLLLKIDRCLMAHGLEGRTPFLDPEVAAFAFPLPDRLKVRGGRGKWLLRLWLSRACAAADPWAKKRGFTVPVAAFMAPRLGLLRERIPRAAGLAGLVTPEEVRAVFDEEARADQRWPLLFAALWFAIHVEGASPDEASALYLGA